MRCLRSVLVTLTALFITSTLIAQSPQIMPRIAGPVDERSLVVLNGNVPFVAKAEFDRGEAPASTELSHVRVLLARSSEQRAALDKYVAELQDKASPNYHKWLTPAQFGKLYGPADSDIAAIVAWLESHGVKVDPVSPGRTNISFSGSVQQIQQLLHISIHSFEVRGEQFLSNTSNPSIPAALVPAISGVARLNTIRPRPQHSKGQMGLYNASARRMHGASQGAPRGPRANLTTGGGTGADPYILYLVPGDAATIYNTPNTVLNANFASGTSYTGTGVTIGIGGDATINPGTVASYRKRFLGDTKQPTVINVDNTTATGDTDEAYLDNEIAGGLAPGADIIFYTASILDVAIEQMLNDNTVDIFSLSFGACELDLTTSDNQLINGWWQQAASQGIAVAVSTGDDGSAACDFNTQTAGGGLLVSGYASTPYNIAVGGTDFGPLLNNFTTYAIPEPSSSAAAAVFYRTALKYIPEWTWNDSTTNNTNFNANVPYQDSSFNTNIVAASGGKSTCSTNTTTYTQQPTGGFVENKGTCTSGYSKPSWQRGAGVPNDSARDIPDISVMGGAGGDAASWLVCTDDKGPNSSGVTVTADCTDQTDTNFYFFGFGGTSTSTPAFAGMLALLQQKAGGRLGLPAQQLYDLFNGSHSAAIFHDTTTGNISVPCTQGTADCAKNTAGYYFLTGYDTTAGYDLATGMGSLDVNQLLTYWGTADGAGTTTVTVTPSATTIVRATDHLDVVVTVVGTSTTGNPTGTVMLSGGGYFTSSGETLTASGADSATYTFGFPPETFAKGTDILTVSYSGDTHYATQTGTTTVTVNGLTPTVTVTPSTATLNSAASTTVGVLVAGTGPTPTGTVTLSGGGYTSAAQAVNGTGAYTFTVPAYSFTTSGLVTLTANYSGDADYNANSKTASITVAVSTFTISATPITLAAGATSGNASTVTVTPANGYTGTVTLTAAVTASPTGAVVPPTLTGSSVNITSATPQTGTVTVATTAAAAVRTGSPVSAWLRAAGGSTMAAFLLFFLPLGSRRGRKMLSAMLVLLAATFTAVGCGSSHTTPTPTKTTPSVTVSPTPTSFPSNTAVSVAISVSGGTQMATGTVTLSGGGYSGTATSLASGAATVNIPANSLSVGTPTLSAAYSGDTNFNPANGTSIVTVKGPGTTKGAYTVTVTAKDTAANITQTTTFTLTVN